MTQTYDPRAERRANYFFWLPISSRWADCDAYGHVNNAMYYNWFDTALTTMLIERGIVGPGQPSIGLCVTSGCDFLAPIEFPATVDAGVRIGRVGAKSLRYEIALFPQGEEEPTAVGFFVHAFVNRETRQSMALNDTQKAAVADLVPAA